MALEAGYRLDEGLVLAVAFEYRPLLGIMELDGY